MLSKYLTIKDKKYEKDFECHYNFGFELDHFQKHAIQSINDGENILVTAHTGSGKTVPAIYAIADSLKKGKKILYTSPIKSLSNQKYQELSNKFDSVGILTGDIKYNPDAQCIILTTEILRNMLYKKHNSNDDTLNLDDVDKIIFDEIHYINDPNRGKVWEETIILLSPDIQLVMLSATIDKADKFASWIGDLKDKNISLIPTNKRVVPLEHNIYMPHNELICFIDSNKRFKNYNKIQEKYQKNNLFTILPKFIEYLKKENYLPTLFFVFSRKECEKLANKTTINLITNEERSEIRNIFDFNLRNYKDIYEKLPQYQDVVKILDRGVAFHHSGLIPILKEIIEILFSKGLIKVLYATETFAVGVNMPTKVVVFPRLSKFSDGKIRNLRTDEYLQMAGRAGRRGIDKFGKVIILPTDSFPTYSTFKSITHGNSPSIKSKFTLSYQFILKILKNDNISMSEFLENSLFAIDNLNEIKILNYEIKDCENELKILPKISQKEYEDCSEYININDKVNGFIKLKKKERKKYLNEMNDIKNLYKNFDGILDKYKSIFDQKDIIYKKTKDIEYIKKFVTKDINLMKDFMIDKNYLSINNKEVSLTEKGYIASEINECNELLLTEILNEKIFNNLEIHEIVCILSIFIEEKDNSFENQSVSNLNIPSKIKDIFNWIGNKACSLADEEYNYKINIGTDWQLYLSFIEPIYYWALGWSIYEIHDKICNIYDGNFIKNIIRIHNICENLKTICDITKDDILLKKLDSVEKILIRDQVRVDSLYI